MFERDKKTGNQVWRPKASPSYQGSKQPEVSATPKNLSGNKDYAGIVAKHGAANRVVVTSDNGKHSVESSHPDGFSHSSSHDDAHLAYEAGGQLQNQDVKKSAHPDQQGAASQGDNDKIPSFEMPDLA